MQFEHIRDQTKRRFQKARNINNWMNKVHLWHTLYDLTPIMPLVLSFYEAAGDEDVNDAREYFFEVKDKFYQGKPWPERTEL